MDKPEIVRAWCAQRVGCPYIYGGTGQPCTPDYRKARMNQYPAYAEKIKRNCPRLTGKATDCSGCKWCDPETGIGKPAYDCAQLSRRAMEAVGISLVSGANSQWEKTHWQERGKIADLPNWLFDKVFLVFRYDDEKRGMGHVGVYQRDGNVVHAKGHDYGVVCQPISEVNFTHWGIPMGLYTEVEPVDYPTLRRGDSGDAVRQMQTLLILLDYLPAIKTNGESNADGIFGAKTEEAVRAFQRDQGLGSDGVCGPATWSALIRETSHDEDALPDEPAPEPEPDTGETTTLSKADWNAVRAATAIMHQIVKKYESMMG